MAGIDFTSWKTWVVIIVVIVIVVWLVTGGSSALTSVGLQPLRSLINEVNGVYVVNGVNPLNRVNAVEEVNPVNEQPSRPRVVIPQGEPSQNIASEREGEPNLPRRVRNPPAPSPPRSRPNRRIGESLTCDVFSDIIGRPVQRGIRPDFLRNPATGRNLEYDCYDPVSKTAVEYDGRQHREEVKFFRDAGHSLSDQQRRDQLKDELSRAAGVHLIRVPDTVDTYDNGRRNPRISVAERERRLREYLSERINV